MNKEQIINNMPSADWIKCCIPFLFELPKLLQNVNVILNVCSSYNKTRKKIQK